MQGIHIPKFVNRAEILQILKKIKIENDKVVYTKLTLNSVLSLKC